MQNNTEITWVPKPQESKKLPPPVTHKPKKENKENKPTSQFTHNEEKPIPSTTKKETKKTKPCKDGYLCKRHYWNACTRVHTEQEIAYIAKSKFLFSHFIKSKKEKFILGTVSKAENDKHLFIPLNKEIIEKYPDLMFVVVKSIEITLSDKYYYKALYIDEKSKDGEFFVSIVEIEQNFGKHNEERHGPSTTQKETKNMKPCKDGYLCKRYLLNTCTRTHTEQEIAYLEKSNFLFSHFIKHKQEKGDKEEKLMLGTISKIEGDKHLFIPLNKEIIERYPDLRFVVVKRTETILSEQHYYEALYIDEKSKDGEFFVSIVEREKNWGKIGKEKDDINALFYGHRPIYQEENEFTGDFKTGILRERFDGKIILKCSQSKKDYIFLDELHQNRALLGSTVHFLEIQGEHSADRGFRRYKGAQVVSILRCPYSRDYIYGILEISSEAQNQINVSDLYCDHPQGIDWNRLEEIFKESNRNLINSLLAKSLITREDFIDEHCKKLNLKPEDFDYLTHLIFKTHDDIEDNLLRRIWASLSELAWQRKEISKLKTCFFKPLNKNLPTFQCLYIQDELKENPEIWRNYVKASYICWPSSSKHPWVRIESAEGFIGDPGSDVRVILANNNVKTDKFSTKVQKQEEEIVKSWQKKIEENLKSLGEYDEKIFSIDGSRAKIRDDAFSIQRLSREYEGCYRIGIHISDVTKIIKESSEIYKEGESRFHSCYVGKSFYKPMLPHKIQKNLSLKQDQWRFAFSIYIMINKDGVINLDKTEFKHGIIKPVANFTYKQVDEQFANPEKNTIQCGDQVKDSLFLMRDLALKISERRENLGYKLDISEEDEEDCARNSQGHMLVEEFMLLTNEIVTEYVEHQASSLESKMVKVRNEEKRIAREELEAEQEAKRKAKEEKQKQQELKRQEKERKKKEREAKKEKEKEAKKEKKEKNKEKKTVKKIVKKTIKKQIINENNEEVHVEEEIEEVVEEDVLELEEDHFEAEEEVKENEHEHENEHESEDEEEEKLEEEEEEKEVISEDEEEMRVKRRGSEDEDEIESEADSYALNIDIIEENSAFAACGFLGHIWKSIDKKKNLDLTDQQKYSESVKSILYDASIKATIKDYVRYLLRINDRKIKLVLSKNLKSKAADKTKERKLIIPRDQQHEEEKFDDYNKNELLEVETEHSQEMKGQTRDLREQKVEVVLVSANDIKAGNAYENNTGVEKHSKNKKGDKEVKPKEEKKKSKLPREDKTKKEELDRPEICKEDMSVKLSIKGQHDMKTEGIAENQELIDKDSGEKELEKGSESSKISKESKRQEKKNNKKEHINKKVFDRSSRKIWNDIKVENIKSSNENGEKEIELDKSSKTSKISKRMKAQKDKNSSKLREEKKTQDGEIEESKEDPSIKIEDMIRSIGNNETNEKETKYNEIKLAKNRTRVEKRLERKAERRAKKEKESSELPKEKDAQNGELAKPEESKEDSSVGSSVLVQNDSKTEVSNGNNYPTDKKAKDNEMEKGIESLKKQTGKRAKRDKDSSKLVEETEIQHKEIEEGQEDSSIKMEDMIRSIGNNETNEKETKDKEIKFAKNRTRVERRLGKAERRALKEKNSSELPKEKDTQNEELDRLEENKEDCNAESSALVQNDVKIETIIGNKETNEKEMQDSEIKLAKNRRKVERRLEKKAERRAKKEKESSELRKEKDTQNGELNRPEGNKEDCNVESSALVQNDVKIESIIESNEANEKDMVIESSKDIKEEEKIKNEELDMIKLKKLESEFNVKLSENIIKRYYKLKDSQKMKFTSPIRRFHDVLVHYLIGDILEIEEKIKTIGKAIEAKLSEQEKAKEKPNGKAGKKKSKKNKKSKTKTRYEIFKELDSQLQDRIKGLAKKQKNIRAYYEENCDIREKGMDRAEREIEIMETCKTIISTNKSEITNALIVKIDNGEVRVFLLEYSFECALVNRYIFAYGRYPKVEMESGPPVEIHLFEDIKVQVNIKKTFPLNFEVRFYSKLR